MNRFTIAALLVGLLPTWALAQNSEWMNFTSGAKVYALADEGEYLWVGGIGLTKLNKATGQMVFYNTANSGLPNNKVLSLAIDAQGNKWIGTWGGGLAKFDGANWTVYRTDNSGLPDNWITDLTIDAQGNKWIVTKGGLVKFDGAGWTVYDTANSGLPNNEVLSLAIDAQGNKWIGTYGGGLAKFDGATWTVHNTGNSGLPDNYVYALAIDAQGNKWIGTWYGGLAKFDGANWTLYNTNYSELPNNSVSALAVDAQGNKWIGTWGGGLAKFDGASWTVYNTDDSGLPDNQIWSLAIDAQGNTWIGTYDGGLAKFDGASWTVYNTNYSELPSNSVSALAVDAQGNKWIGTWGGGLAKFDGASWTVYKTRNSKLPDNSVSALAIDVQGNIWIGTWNRLAKFDGARWRVDNIGNAGLPNNWVRALAIDAQGNTWIGTDEGLAKLAVTNYWTVYNTDNSELPDNDVTALAIDAQRNKWIGTGNGLAKFDGVSWTVYTRYNSGLWYDWVSALAIDAQGNISIGTWRGGLAKFDGVNWTIYNTDNSGLPNNHIQALAIDSQGNTWIGTEEGLAKFDGANWTIYDTYNSGLLNNNICALAIDAKGNKWIGTPQGLAIYREGGVILHGEVPKPDLKIYSVSFLESPTAMKPATVTLKIINDGDTTSASGNLKISLCVLRENLQPFQGDLIDLGRVEAIAPGEIKTLSFPYTFISNAYSKYLEVTLILEAGMDGNLQNNTTRIDFVPLPNEQAYWNCIGEITAIFSSGLLSGKEDIEFAKDIIFFAWDGARDSYGLSDALRDGDVRKVITIFCEMVWNVGKDVFKLSGKELIEKAMSYVKLVYSTIQAASNEGKFLGCGEVMPSVWEVLKELSKIIWEKIKAAGESVFFFIVDSPAELVVQDSSGHITAVTQEAVTEGIENSFGFCFEGHSFISVIGNDIYSVKVKGTGAGECGLSIFKPQPDGNLLNFSYANLPTTPNSESKLVVGEQISEYTLSLDLNGDGIADDTRAPDTVQVITEVQEVHRSLMPSTFLLSENYPNPFNTTTSISFNIPKQCHVKIAIYNVIGELVRDLVNSEYAPGIYHVQWDGTNSENASMPSGAYIYRMAADEEAITKKMLLLR